MKNVPQLSLILLCFLLGFTQVTYGQGESDDSNSEESQDEVEPNEEERKSLVSNKVKEVQDLLGYNFYSSEVQSYLESIGIEGDYYGDQVILKIPILQGMDIEFNSLRNLTQIKYATDYISDLPYDLSPDMKFRQAKKRLGKNVRKSDRRTLYLMDNLLEVMVKYPTSGPRKKIKTVSLNSLREAVPCDYCEKMHLRAAGEFWSELSEDYEEQINEQEEKRKSEQERIRQEALEEAERIAAQKAEYERRERERLEEYHRQEEKRKEAANDANPLCFALQSIFSEGPSFESIQGPLISEDNTDYELASYFKATRSLLGFEECSISQITNLYFLEMFMSYNAKASFKSLEDAKEFYRNTNQQILMCEDYQRTEKASNSNSIEGSTYIMKSEIRSTLIRVQLFVVKNQNNNYVVHLKIQDEID